ncbi:hypothetical protein J6590_061065 [Homalodisca vitripennis]|nr:hypothetical protein J6590_061065 [Homalodisca vitripennis]
MQPPVTERKDLPRATSLDAASGDREERSTPEPQVSLQPPVTERKDLPRATSIDAASSDQEERSTQSHKGKIFPEPQVSMQPPVTEREGLRQSHMSRRQPSVLNRMRKDQFLVYPITSGLAESVNKLGYSNIYQAFNSSNKNVHPS